MFKKTKKDSPVHRTPESHFKMPITQPIGKKIRNGPRTCLMGPGGVVWGKKPSTKNLVRLSLYSFKRVRNCVWKIHGFLNRFSYGISVTKSHAKSIKVTKRNKFCKLKILSEIQHFIIPRSQGPCHV